MRDLDKFIAAILGPEMSIMWDGRFICEPDIIGRYAYDLHEAKVHLSDVGTLDLPKYPKIDVVLDGVNLPRPDRVAFGQVLVEASDDAAIYMVRSKVQGASINMFLHYRLSDVVEFKISEGE